MNLPTTSTLIVLPQSLQSNPWHNSTAQVNMPLSPSVTFEIITVNFSVDVQLKLYLWSDGFANPACPDDRTPATLTPLNVTVNPSKLKSDEKLKFQLSGESVTPSWSCTVFNLWSKLWSKSVSSGGGSYHVTLTPSEIKISVVVQHHTMLTRLQTLNYQLQMAGRAYSSHYQQHKVCKLSLFSGQVVRSWDRATQG